MTIIIELNDLVNRANDNTAVTQINQNSETIEGGFSTALNATGDKMLGTLDLNSNQIINLPAPGSAMSPVRLVDIQNLTGGGSISTVNLIAGTGINISGTTVSVSLTGTTGINVSGAMISMTTTGVSSGTYGDISDIPIITLNAQGQVTAISTTAVVASAGTLSGATLNSSVVSSSLTSLGVVTNLSAITISSNTNISAGGQVIVAAGGNSTVIGNATISTTFFNASQITTADLTTANASFSNRLLFPLNTVTTLPVFPVQGMVSVVTDASSISFGSGVTGGGTGIVLVLYNGSGWIEV